MNILREISSLVRAEPSSWAATTKTCRMAGWVALAMLPRQELSTGTARHSRTERPTALATSSNPALNILNKIK